MKLSFVIVAADAAKYIGDCLASVRAAASEMTGLAESTDIIVVDRASTDATAKAVRDAAPEAVLVDAPAGLGFAAAANLGIARATGDVFIFVDPAVTLCPGAARRLAEHMDTTPACMVAGGMVTGPKDAVLRGAARLPGLIVKLARLSGLPARLPRTWFNWPAYGEKHFQQPTRVQSVSLAFAAVKAAALRKLGPLDERFQGDAFTGHDLCRRIRRAVMFDWNVAVVPQARACAQDAFVLRPEIEDFDLNGDGVVRTRVRDEMLYVWKNYCVLTSLGNSLLELAGTSVRYVVSMLPGIGCDKCARHNTAVLRETSQAMLDTQLGMQYPTTPW